MGCLKARAAALAAPAARAYARLAARYAVADEVVEAWTRRLLVANTALGCASAAVRLLLGGAGCVTYNVVLAIALTACAVDLGLAAVYLGFRRRWCCVSLHEDGVIAFIFTIIPGMSLAVGAWCCGEHRTLTATLLSAKVFAQACYLGAFARVQVLRRRRDLALAQQERWDEVRRIVLATKTSITGQDKSDSTSLQCERSARARSGKRINASRPFREMIARPKISRNEWKTAEIGAFEVGNFALLSCPG